MLGALHKNHGTRVALSGSESEGECQQLRMQTKGGILVCPSCRHLLRLRMGNIRAWHFAHQSIGDCSHGQGSETVQYARRVLYHFFKSRIISGEISGEVALEPVLPDLPKGICVDLLLRRTGRPSVAVVLIESNLKPNLRRNIPEWLTRNNMLFRPVFLSSKLNGLRGERDAFQLDPTQRELMEHSPYDEAAGGYRYGPGTLRFIEPSLDQWMTLRGLKLLHPPQVYRASELHGSTMGELHWSNAHDEWVHKKDEVALRQL
jgi:hypothetical protein